MDNIFAKIARKEIPAAVIYEDDNSLAFLDITPLAAGHTLVIPKTEAATILDLPEKEVGMLFESVKKVTSILQNSLKPAGFTIGVNHGSVSGQSVEYLHVHIIPRYEGDGGGSIHSIIKNTSQEPVEDVKNRILQNLDK